MLQQKIERRKFLKILGVGAVSAIVVAAAAGLGTLPSMFDRNQPVPVAAQSNGRPYSQIVTEEFIPRMNAALGSIRTALITAGIPASNITITELDSNDLRYQIIVRRGNRTLTGYIELTDGVHTLGDAGRGQAIFTFWLDGNGTEITTTYAPGGLQPYTTEAGLDMLLGKLGEVEGTIPEAVTKIRVFLGL